MLKRMTYLLFLLLLCLYPVSSSLANAEIKEQKNQMLENKDYTVYKQFKGMEKPYAGPLPWEKNKDFKKVLSDNHTPIRMAAYKATLHDPLMSEAYNIGLAAQQLCGTVVKPGETFSQNETIGPYTRERGYQEGPTYAGNKITTTVGGGVCKIASLLYNVVTFSDLPVVMRDSHSMLVPYVPPGQDATVYYGVRDFRFLNNLDAPILIWAQKVDNTLYMALYGSYHPPKVVWHHEVKKRIDFWTQYQYNQALNPGEEKEIIAGMDGYIIRSWVTVEKPGEDKLIKKKGMSYYNPCPRIVEQGPQK